MESLKHIVQQQEWDVPVPNRASLLQLDYIKISLTPGVTDVQMIELWRAKIPRLTTQWPNTILWPIDCLLVEGRQGMQSLVKWKQLTIYILY
jgi:hypothetical protein